jgi:signal transduction histidine kinase
LELFKRQIFPYSPGLVMPARSCILGLAGLLLALASEGATSLAQHPEAESLVLTNAAQIRQLSAAQAAQHFSAYLRGVVITEAGPAEHAAVIWDGTAGIYLLSASNHFSNVHRGDLLEVTGVTDPGEFAPILKLTTLKKMGHGSLPQARRVTYDELLGGGLDAQWVEISGVVRSLDRQVPRDVFGKWHMDVALGSGKISVVSNGPRPEESEPDARVRLQATCFYQFTRKRQVVRPMLLVPGGVSIQVEQPAPANAFNARVRPVGTLLEFSPERASGHRVHVRGVVTHQQAGAMVWLRDDSGALRIETRQSEPLQPGDVIDVLGFPKFGAYTPLLEDAVVQKSSSGNPPPPIRLATAAAAFDHQADLVALSGSVSDVQPLPDGWSLTLQQTGQVFKALFRSPDRAQKTPAWQPGSLVRVTGICSVISDDAGLVLSGIWRPQAFQVLLRSPADVALLRPPTWWTPAHFVLLLLSLTGASLLVAAVVMLLSRRRLHEQVQRRAMAEAEFAAILSERNRVAREIHDTLAQGLVATSVQLRLAKKGANGAPEALIQHLDLAQQLVRENLEEARKSIWNMRSQVLETGDLASALKGILQQMAQGTQIHTEFHVNGRQRRLAPVLENNVLRIGQEAISNAVRHAAAASIFVHLVFDEKVFRLTVTDDGRGFDPAKPMSGNGGFGLVGMRERATQMHGELSVRPTSRRGTEVSLRVPLSGD